MRTSWSSNILIPLEDLRETLLRREGPDLVMTLEPTVRVLVILNESNVRKKIKIQIQKLSNPDLNSLSLLTWEFYL